MALHLRNSPPHTLASLIYFVKHQLPHVKFFDPSTKSLVPANRPLPWLALWTLITYSPKHRISYSSPPLEWSTKGIQQYINKVAWNLYFSRNPSGDRLAYGKAYKTSTPYCPHLFDLDGNYPDFRNWASHFRRTFLEAVARNNKLHSPSLGILKLGIHEVKKLQHFIVRHDKDNFISLILPEDLDEYFKLTLPEPTYQEIFPSSVNFERIRTHIRRLGARVADTEQDSRWRHIIASHAHLNCTCKVGTKLKAHKDQGFIVPRAIHIGLDSAYRGLSQWLNTKLKPLLASLSHVVIDSKHMKTELENIEGITEFTTMSCFDLKDFYLSGKSDDIVAVVVRNLDMDRKMRDTFREVLWHILEWQFVTTPTSPNLWQCVLGSGIGLEHSAAVTNLCFYYLCEVPLLPRLQEIGVHKIVMY